MGKDQEEKSQESSIKILKLDMEREGVEIGRERKGEKRDLVESKEFIQEDIYIYKTKIAKR